MTESGKWMESLYPKTVIDKHITGRYGFNLYRKRATIDQVFFSSGSVYSSYEDAEQAGDDAAHAAWLFRNLED